MSILRKNNGAVPGRPLLAASGVSGLADGPYLGDKVHGLLRAVDLSVEGVWRGGGQFSCRYQTSRGVLWLGVAQTCIVVRIIQK